MLGHSPLGSTPLGGDEESAIQPEGIASTEAFGVPRVGGLQIYPAGIASTEAFGVPLVGQQNQSGFFLTF